MLPVYLSTRITLYYTNMFETCSKHVASVAAKSWDLPGLVNIQKAIEHGPVEIVSFPIKNGDFP